MAPQFSNVIQTARDAFATGKTRDLNFRKTQLKSLLRMYTENESAICDALASDLRKSKSESILSEIVQLIKDIKHILANIDSWAKPDHPPKTVLNLMDDLSIYKDPYGVVLIIGAWNYPFFVTLIPVAPAIAAGNCVIIKPSEIAPASAKLMEELIPKYLDKQCYPVINGGVNETSELLKNRFDYIFFTGSPAVGKIVHAAAAKYLTPVTLELGGKSPVFIDSTADCEIAFKRIIWGKLINCGQTCIAPDYVLCTRETQEKFIDMAPRIIEELYGNDVKSSPDYVRIINDKHFKRLSKFLKNNSNIAVGGKMDANDRYIEPTILANVSADDPIMNEEIFGPILPIVVVQTVYDAIHFINLREKPLALYIFSKNQKDIKMILNNTSSEGVCVNDTLTHLIAEALPFGGVGNSGMGAYKHKYGFDTFTHKKGILRRNLGSLGESIQKLRYPPYTEKKLTLASLALKIRPYFISYGFFGYLVCFLIGILLGFGMQYVITKIN